MFTDVKTFLNHPSHCMKSKYTIGIVEIQTDTSFLFHHFLSHFLKEDCNVVFISFCQSFNHFNSVGNKIGNNLTRENEQKHFLFIEGLKKLAQAVNKGTLTGDGRWNLCVKENGKICVKTLFESLKESIEMFRAETDRKLILIIDSLTMLSDVGMQVRDTIALMHYLKIYITEELAGTLVFGLNNDFGEEDEDGDFVKKFAQHSVDLLIEVKGLETGYCKDVHGQLAVTWYKSAARKQADTKTSQFKLTEKSCAIFASGMSSAVL